jgi:hypothetical protein
VVAAQAVQSGMGDNFGRHCQAVDLVFYLEVVRFIVVNAQTMLNVFVDSVLEQLSPFIFLATDVGKLYHLVVSHW